VSRGTLDHSHFALPFVYGAFTLFGLPFQVARLGLTQFTLVLNPASVATHGLGSSRFARRYFGNLN
jgi:hypothetical protein